MSLKQAEKSWSMWHQKAPRAWYEIDYSFPPQVQLVGIAETIIYVSDKWEEDGHFYDYIHEHETAPKVYMVDGEGPSKSTKQLLRTREDLQRGELALPMLGTVKELIIMPTGAEAKHCLRFKEKPILCCTTDHKTLVIFSESRGPIFIRGGRMVVTERGIVG